MIIPWLKLLLIFLWRFRKIIIISSVISAKTGSFYFVKMGNTNKKIRGRDWIFFDLDGTLADTMPALYNIYIKFLDNFKKRGTREEFLMCSGSLPEIILFLRSRHDLKASRDDLLKLYRKEVLASYGKLKPVKNARMVLRELNELNYKLMLVTSAEKDTAMGFILRQGWQKYFQNYVFGNEVENAKPNPAIYRLALEKAGIGPRAAGGGEESPHGGQVSKKTKIIKL